MKKETLAIRTQLDKSHYGEHSVPLYMTSSYAFENAEHMRALFSEEEEGFVYSRYSNPNVTEFIDKICLLEEAESGWATASGMAAIFSTFAGLLSQGNHILSCRSIFGSTHKLFTEILPRWGITHSYVSFDALDTWEESINENTKILYIESPTNPALDIIDISAAAAIAKRNNLILVVDNCFATPINQNPIKLGADLVIHSATKFLDGQGRAMGGVIVGTDNLIQKIQAFARHSGPALSPFNAWVLSKSIETLSLRMDKHADSAATLAAKIEQHANVKQVKYPFLKSHPQYEIATKQMKNGGALFSFEIEGGIEKGRKFLDSLKMITLTANLGDSRTIATHPASTTHSKLTEEERLSVGITPGLIRISVGLEHVDDIWDDILLGLES